MNKTTHRMALVTTVVRVTITMVMIAAVLSVHACVEHRSAGRLSN